MHHADREAETDQKGRRTRHSKPPAGPFLFTEQFHAQAVEQSPAEFRPNVVEDSLPQRRRWFGTRSERQKAFDSFGF